MRTRARNRLADALTLVALLALGGYATMPVWRDIFAVAVRDPEQSHILLAIPTAAWLAWLRRGRARFCRRAPSIIGPALIGAGGLLSLLGLRYGVEVAWHSGALLILIGIPVAVFGADLLINFLPSVCVLLFLLPVPGRVRQEIALPLQQASAQAAEFILDLFGLPIGRSGNVLVINDVQVAVADACNGMRAVAALGLVTFAFVFSVPMRNSVRLVILASSPLIALLVNITRLVPASIFYGYTQKPTADLFHDISGWGVLGLAVGFLWLILALLRWMDYPIAPYGVAEDQRETA